MLVNVPGPGMGKEKFLGEVGLDFGTGAKVAEAVVEKLSLWNIKDNVVALSYDTCAVNTGRHGGKYLVIITY